ncbi:hypothetical protein T439DRAFT_343057 [Meredithblackwellia eburnea MCA 4105]
MVKMVLLALLLGMAQLQLATAQSQPQPNVCKRWSGQMAISTSATGGNSTSTLYYMGGEAMTSQDQTTGLWTNAMVAIDLTKDWPTGTPPITLVTKDTGDQANPPAVALGALWASTNSSKLYLYGGQFSDTPNFPPPQQSIWAYDIQSNNWAVVPTTGDTITRSAEGSTALVPGAGSGGDAMGFYFSGHEDDHTTYQWSNQIARIYLNSMVTFDLGSKVVKNITSYSSTASTSNSSTPEINPVYRADGTLTYVPGLGTNNKGILVAVGGATATQYVDNSVLDVFDIGANGWTKQSTLGDTIGSRVNHCAVRASAKVNGVLTHQIFIYGGQKLNQSDRDSAMYILSIPSYTWTFVGDSLPGQPTGRAGHQCALHGSQLIVVGGVVASSLICDQPGVYVYDVSQSAWQNSFKASSVYSTPEIIANITGGIGTGGSSSGSGSASGGDGSTDPDTSGAGRSPSTTNGGGGGEGKKSSKSNVGPIVGGVVGGLLLLALLAFLFVLSSRRRKQKELRDAAAGIRSPDSIAGVPYEKTNSTSSPHPWRMSEGSSQFQPMYGSDDVEEETRNMEAAFGSHLVPKRTLRVTNPETTDEMSRLNGDPDEPVESLRDSTSTPSH